jgi:hypothetical protein
MFAAPILFKFFYVCSTIISADLQTMWGDVVFIMKLRNAAYHEFAIIAPRGPRSCKDKKKVKSTLSSTAWGAFA